MGVFWPAILWPDEVPEAAGEGGAAGMTSNLALDEVPSDLLKNKVFTGVEQQAVLEELRSLLKQRPKSNEALQRFGEQLHDLISHRPPGTSPEDRLEQVGLGEDERDWLEVFRELEGDEPVEDSEGGSAGLGDVFDRLWRGAKGALRIASYWEMKARAGVVGQQGLGPLIGQLHEIAPNLRIHLIGHSFGARVVSYALAGMSTSTVAGASPVKSLLLIQGAFSHWAFASVLPFDSGRAGDLHGMASRVDGPLLTTHSLHDTAVGRAYPLASFVNRDDSAAFEARLKRWGAMGHDGAQAVAAAEVPLGGIGTVYSFAVGRWLNLDCNMIIKEGGPPSGAHSDIVHPEIAWAALSAADIL